MARSTTNRNARGGSHDRRVRKQWLLDTFGDGIVAPCHFCRRMQTFETISPDRIIPGCEGGTYRRDNIRPACQPCQSSTGGKLGAERAAAKRKGS